MGCGLRRMGCAIHVSQHDACALFASELSCADRGVAVLSEQIFVNNFVCSLALGDRLL